MPRLRPFSRVLGTLGVASAIAVSGALPASAAVTPPSKPVAHYDDGLFGLPDVFSSGYKEALALLVLATRDTSAEPTKSAVTAGVAWLRRQQCADGGWQGYKISGVACGPLSSDPGNSLHYVAADSNTTALVVQALAALGITGAPIPKAVAFLKSLQTSDGGFEFTPGAGSDPNSTALTIQALLAVGIDPATLTKGSNTPYSYLQAQQLGCSAAAGDQGGIQAPFAPGSANGYATVQSLAALAAIPYPVTGKPAPAADSPHLVCPPSGSPLSAHDAAGIAASWVADHLTTSGYLDNGFGGVDYASTAYAVMGFVATGTNGAAFTKALDYLRTHVTGATTKSGKDDVGGLSLTALAAIAGNANPASFGSSNLLTRVLALQYTTPVAPRPSVTATATPSTPAPTVSATTIGEPLPMTGSPTQRLAVQGVLLMLLGAVLVGAAAVRPLTRGRHCA